MGAASMASLSWVDPLVSLVITWISIVSNNPCTGILGTIFRTLKALQEMVQTLTASQTREIVELDSESLLHGSCGASASHSFWHRAQGIGLTILLLVKNCILV